MDIMVLNENLERINILDNYSSFIWTDRYFDAGDYEISGVPSTSLLEALSLGTYLSIENSDRIMLMGSLGIKTDSETGARLTSKGYSLESILKYRILYDNVVLDGNFQNSIESLLNENAINSSDPNRNFTRLIFLSSDDTSIINLTVAAELSEGDILYEVIANLCAEQGVGFKITLSETGNFVFQLYSGKDRSSSQLTNPHVIFSPNFENLLSSDFVTTSENLRTAALVAGESGIGNVRRKIVVSGADEGGSDIHRKEVFINAADIKRNLDDGTVLTDAEYDEQLFSRGALELSKSTALTSFDGKLNTEHTYKLNTDFFLGDIVEVENEFGLSTTGRITEVIYSRDEEGYNVYPTFSSFN